MSNIIIKNGKKFVRPARLPRGAREPKKLLEVLAPFMSKETIKEIQEKQHANDRQ